MNYEKILRGILSKAYKLDAGQIDEFLSTETEKDGKKVPKTDDDVETLILDADKTRITTLTKPKEGQTFSDGYKKGKKEALTDLEKEAKEKFGVETDVTGLELIEAIVEDKTKTAGKKQELTDDDIRKHPYFQNSEKAFKKQLKDKEEELNGKIAEKEKEFNRTSTLNTIKGNAWADVEGLKPVLPKNAAVAQTQKNNFLKAFDAYDFDMADPKNPVVVENGKVKVDQHGHTVTLKDLAKQLAGEHFEFQNNNGGNNGGNDNNDHQNNNGTKTYPAGIVKPKTIEEFAKIVDNQAIKLEDKQIVMEVWESEHSAT